MLFSDMRIRSIIGLLVSSPLFYAVTTTCSAQLAYSELEKNVTAPSDDVTVQWRCEVTNIGTRNVKILDIHTDCGCTLGKGSADSFAPGEKGQINIQMYISRDYPGSEARHLILVKTDDGRVQELKFNATIERPINVSPRILLWKRGEKTPKVVRLTMNEKVTGSHPTGVSGDEKGLFTETITRSDSGGEYLLTITPRSAVDEATLVIDPIFDSPVVGLTGERVEIHLIVR